MRISESTTKKHDLIQEVIWGKRIVALYSTKSAVPVKMLENARSEETHIDPARQDCTHSYMGISSCTPFLYALKMPAWSLLHITGIHEACRWYGNSA